MGKWYEVAVSYVDNCGTETIATFDTLKEAKLYAEDCNDLNDEGVDFVFIDKWYAEEGGSAFKEDSFKAIIYKERLSDSSFYCDKCNCVGDANGGTEQEGNVALLGRTEDDEINIAFGDYEVLCEECLNNNHKENK